MLSAEESIVDVYQKVSSVHRIVGARRLDAGSYICEVIVIAYAGKDKGLHLIVILFD